MNRLLLLALSCLCVGMAAPAHAAPRRLTIREGEALVRAELRGWHNGADHLPGLGIEHYRDETFPAFITYHVDWRSVPEGGSTVGFFDVNPRNGDVWAGTACLEYDSSTLRMAQARLRKQMRLGRKAYLRYRIPGPYCD